MLSFFKKLYNIQELISLQRLLMNIKSIIAATALGIASLFTPTQAQATVDPCTVYMCMAGLSGYGASGGAGCTPAVTYWHTALTVYNPYFNASATAARRQTYMMSCPGAQTGQNAAVFQAIMRTWGRVP